MAMSGVMRGYRNLAAAVIDETARRLQHCVHCGRLFPVRQAGQRYCDAHCKGAAEYQPTAPRPLVACAACGREFWRRWMQALVDVRGRRAFCSAECQRATNAAEQPARMRDYYRRRRAAGMEVG